MRDASVGVLRISVDRLERAVVVRAEGEVDLDTAEKLSAALRTAGSEPGKRVVLDLLGVPFMDSSGLKALLIGSAHLGEPLILALSPGAPVARLLELAEVRDRFVVPATIDAAIAEADGAR
jgi:anti-anti-sigma factor